ncbi:MAG: alpha/beta fold hydrolase [Gammaproteobacteria bacterium]|nr:alpha/beta fold hydrolase [Gammaproteobacteria bacterium]
MVALVTPLASYSQILDRASDERITVDGLGVQLYRWGRGSTCIVLLHGGYGSWAHWIKVIPWLEKSATVIAADMPGFGRSDTPIEPHTAESVAGPLAEALRELVGRQKFILAGFSFGGAIAGHVASLMASQIEHLVLLGPGGTGAPRGEMPDLIRRTKEMSREEIVEAHRRNLEILMVKDASCIDDLALYIQETNTGMHRLKSRPISATDTLARALVGAPYDASVGKYRPEREAILRKSVPHVEIEVIPNVGHWLMWESDELVADRLLALLPK